MSNINNTMQTQTSNALHNAIMEAGSKDRQPMLAPGNYVQWKSIIKRYIDTKHNHELIHNCLQNPSYKYKWVDKEVSVTEAIERLKQGESINVQDLETNLYWEFRKFTSRDVLTLTTTRMAKHQNEVNEIRAERLARTANLLALVAQQQPVYHHQNHPAHYTQNSSTRSQQAATRNRGKAIINSPPPKYDQEPSMVAEDDEMSKDKEIDKLMALISLSFKKIYNLLTTTFEHHQTPVEQIRIILQGLTEASADWNDDTDDESDDQELEAYYMYMAKLQEVSPDAADNSGPIFDPEPSQ
nr:hypothetical protein [Tanacetum cinerariifolium]